MEVFQINDAKVKIEDAQMIVDLDRIRFSFLIINNILNFDEEAQKEFA